MNASKAAQLGVQWAALSGNSTSNYRVGALTGFDTGGNNLISQAATHLAPGGVPLPPGNGLTLGIFSQSGLGALVHALETDTSANISVSYTHLTLPTNREV